VKARDDNGKVVDWLRLAKIVGTTIGAFAVVLMGSYQIIQEHSPIPAESALATEIEKIRGEVNMCKAVTDSVKERLNKFESVISDVNGIKVDTEVLKERVNNLKISVDEIKGSIKEINVKQEKTQEGIEEILRKLRK